MEDFMTLNITIFADMVRASIIAAVSRLNDEVEEREEGREEKWAISLQSASTQELKNL